MLLEAIADVIDRAAAAMSAEDPLSR